jgi:hypothetical protein
MESDEKQPEQDAEETQASEPETTASEPAAEEEAKPESPAAPADGEPLESSDKELERLRRAERAAMIQARELVERLEGLADREQALGGADVDPYLQESSTTS